MKLLATAGKTVKQAAAVVKAVTPPKGHRCDPDGFSCDCARKDDIGGRERWLGRRRGWLR